METASKTCHMCGEEIKNVSKKCPYCQSWQKGSGARLFSSSVGVWVPIIIIWGGMLAFFYYSGIFRDHNSDFEKYSQQVSIKDSRIHYGKEDSTSHISVIGTIKNDSDKKWKRVSIEVQYFDQSGAMIDTQTDNNYDLVLLPRSEHAFRLRENADKAESAYHSHKVFVRDAESGDRWP